MSETLTRRRHRRRVIRLAVYGALLVIIAVVAALIVTGRTVVPVFSEQIFPIHYRAEIAAVSEQYGLNPYLVSAVVKTESGYDPAAVSSAGAVGLMQVMPDTAEWITGLNTWQGGSRPVLADPRDNLQLGACYLGYLLETFGYEILPALAAYNAGQGAVQVWVDEVGGVGLLTLDDIRFRETRDFVERVQGYLDLYYRIYPDAFVGIDDAS
ncbi:MAG: hypothetical protein A2133_09555 [Actinobacteria bacterium RBG_16_64_13]|nr:MAG: hypothetical protein A2133_09555 [Actinobacteria bacterium RBG_16_64_13]